MKRTTRKRGAMPKELEKEGRRREMTRKRKENPAGAVFCRIGYL